MVGRKRTRICFDNSIYSIPELERQICRETGSQYAEKFQWKARWTKASRFQAEFSPGVICAVEYTAEAQDQVETPKLNRILFGGAVSLSCDYYNDELIESHPLFGAGLVDIGFYNVCNSNYLTRFKKSQSFPKNISNSQIDQFKHFLLLFKDGSIDILAKSVELESYE